jgi:hypothetical protein
MNITEFLEARISEDDAAAKAAIENYAPNAWDNPATGGNYYPADVAFWDMHTPSRILAECAAKRAIIKQHESWPVLVERKPSELETVAGGLGSITYRMTSEIAWLTTREYIKRFGTEPPTAPMILTLAAVYSDHPDYRQEWAS